MYERFIKIEKNNMSDFYAIMVCLCVPDLDNYHGWEDFKDKFYPEISLVGMDNENMDGFQYKCCCSHHVRSENVTVIRCGNHYLAVGDVCIKKNSIVYKFEEFMKKKKAIFKERSITTRKPHPLKKFLNREIEDYKPASVLSYEAYTASLKELRNKKNQETPETCVCGAPRSLHSRGYPCKHKERLNKEIEDYKPAVALSYEAHTASLKELRKKYEADQRTYEADQRTCACGRPCKTYMQCYLCKVRTQDMCTCGALKDKKYSTCYPCHNLQLSKKIIKRY